MLKSIYVFVLVLKLSRNCPVPLFRNARFVPLNLPYLQGVCSLRPSELSLSPRGVFFDSFAFHPASGLWLPLYFHCVILRTGEGAWWEVVPRRLPRNDLPSGASLGQELQGTELQSIYVSTIEFMLVFVIQKLHGFFNLSYTKQIGVVFYILVTCVQCANFSAVISHVSPSRSLWWVIAPTEPAMVPHPHPCPQMYVHATAPPSPLILALSWASAPAVVTSTRGL